MINLRFIAFFWDGGLKQWWGKVCEAAQLSLIHKQRVVDVNRRWNEVAKLERQGLTQDDGPLLDAVNDAFMAQDFARVIETEKLLLRAAMCGAEGIPPKRVGEFYSRMVWDDDPDEPFYLTDSGMLKVRGAIAEAGKRKRERIAFWAAIFFGLAGSITGLISAIASLNNQDTSKIEVVLREPAQSQPLPPAIWRNPTTFDPVEHFFLFPPAGAAKQKWAGEIRSLR